MAADVKLSWERVSYNLEHELSRARAKFPGNKDLLPALMEEVGELSKSLLERGPNTSTYMEAIQVACVALRIASEGCPEFNFTPDYDCYAFM